MTTKQKRWPGFSPNCDDNYATKMAIEDAVRLMNSYIHAMERSGQEAIIDSDVISECCWEAIADEERSDRVDEQAVIVTVYEHFGVSTENLY